MIKLQIALTSIPPRERESVCGWVPPFNRLESRIKIWRTASSAMMEVEVGTE